MSQPHGSDTTEQRGDGTHALIKRSEKTQLQVLPIHSSPPMDTKSNGSTFDTLPINIPENEKRPSVVSKSHTHEALINSTQNGLLTEYQNICPLCSQEVPIRLQLDLWRNYLAMLNIIYSRSRFNPQDREPGEWECTGLNELPEVDTTRRNDECRNLIGGTHNSGKGTFKRENPFTPISTRVPASCLNTGYYERFFEEEYCLGHGSYGKVCKCVHKIDGDILGIFAVKKIPIGDDKAHLRKIVREVKTLERIAYSPYVVSYKHSWIEIYKENAFCVEVPYLFILMNYCDAGSLESRIFHKEESDSGTPPRARARRQDRVLSLEYPFQTPNTDEMWSWTLDIIHGLNHLHQHGIIHRDLKPANILLMTGVFPVGVPDRNTGTAHTSVKRVIYPGTDDTVDKNEDCHKDARYSSEEIYHNIKTDKDPPRQESQKCSTVMGSLDGCIFSSDPHYTSLVCHRTTVSTRALISDFGTAELVEKESDHEVSGFTGTVEYTAPEILTRIFEKGKSKNGSSDTESDLKRSEFPPRYDEKSDMWSLGVIIYAMLFSRLPFSIYKEPEMTAQVVCRYEGVNGTDFELDGTDIDRDPRIIELADALLRNDPEKRPTCCELLHNEIIRCVNRFRFEGI